MAQSRKLLTVGALGVAAAALIATGSGVTGAYFTDSNSGVITGDVGSIKLGGQNLNLKFDNLLPGVAQTVTVPFSNSGTEAQDVWLTFPVGSALHALNNLGTYGEVHVVNNVGQSVFDSANLQDGRTRADGTNSCGGFAQTVPAKDGCWPLPAKIKVASNVASGATSAATFTFMYASKLTGSGGGVFNTFPSVGRGQEAFNTDLTPAGTGLPFDVVAVQVGQTP